jgi:uncharacterized protein
MSFFHGVESIVLPGDVSSVNTVKTAVIGLIGCATTPTGSDTVNKLKLCLSDVDDAQYGIAGSIPEALVAIRSQGAATVLVVNLGTGTPAPDAAAFIGTVNAETGARTGLKVFDLAFSTLGFRPKIIIAPGYSSATGIAAALVACAETHRGCAYLDSPTGQIVSAAIASRGAGNPWNLSTTRAKLLYPGVKNALGVVKPMSAYSAGLRAKIDREENFWTSSSNHDIKGITGLETPITFAINDINSEANTLNAAGIVTIANTYGTGYREWGNRNASFPVKSDPLTFESVQRLDDITSESIELAMFPFLDRPINQALIDSILNTVNGYFNTLISQGALIEGSKCYFESSKNSAVEIAAGHLTFTKVFIGAIPGERITFYSKIDVNLLNNLI